MELVERLVRLAASEAIEEHEVVALAAEMIPALEMCRHAYLEISKRIDRMIAEDLARNGSAAEVQRLQDVVWSADADVSTILSPDVQHHLAMVVRIAEEGTDSGRNLSQRAGSIVEVLANAHFGLVSDFRSLVPLALVKVDCQRSSMTRH